MKKVISTKLENNLIEFLKKEAKEQDQTISKIIRKIIIREKLRKDKKQKSQKWEKDIEESLRIAQTKWIDTD